MDEHISDSLNRIRLSNEGTQLESLIRVLNVRYAIQKLCKANKITGPELALADCLSEKSACSEYSHASICLIRPKDFFWRKFELLAIYECTGEFFGYLIEGSKKEFKKALPSPQNSFKLVTAELSQITDGKSAVNNRILRHQAVMSNVLSFAAYMPMNLSDQDPYEVLKKFDTLTNFASEQFNKTLGL